MEKVNYKIWIARDEAIYETDEKITGNIHIFYDSPQLLRDTEKNIKTWQNARVICEAPKYMFPEIKEGTCALFEFSELLTLI